jgi:autoinducer 2 (AI-2) kinase
MDFDWKHNWNLTCGCIRGVLEDTKIDAEEISAVATTSMREGIVLYDKDGKEIWACANVDARANDEVSELKSRNPELEKEIYYESGQTYALGALPRILWVKNKMPEIYDKVAMVGMFNDWLIYKLTGKLAVEPSNGSTTGIFNLQNRSWDPAIAEKCGLRTDIFPPTAESGTLIGTVNAQGAKDTLLAEGTPVVVGGGDAQLGCIGVGVVKPGQAAVFGGSFWQYEFNTADGRTDPDCHIRVNCHAVPGVWQYEAIAFNPGLIMRWYRDAFCQLEKRESEKSGKDPYYLMDKEAEKIPAGYYGMMCAFSDVMNFISWKHAAPTFTNFELDSDKFNRFTFYRAIMENTAMVTKGHLDLVKEATGNMPESIVFASGASKSPLWCQILSDTLGLPVRVPAVKEATGLGAAILAGYGAGIFKDIKNAVSQLVRIDKTYQPNMENHAIYNKLYAPWRKVYAAQLNLSDQKLTKNMWIAPGL